MNGLCRTNNGVLLTVLVLQGSAALAATDSANDIMGPIMNPWILALFVMLFALIVLLVIKVRRYGKNLSKLETELARLSRTDELTQLLNRRYLEKRLYEDFEFHLRHPEANSVLMMVGVDQFDDLTDAYGHAAGDLVVQTIANIIQARVRTTDLCGRFAEEAFLVSLRDTAIQPAVTLADEVRQKVADTGLFYGQKTNQVTCSVGLVALSQDMVSCRDWIQQAEQALYQAKQQGVNQTAVFNKTSDESTNQ